jgi:GT2 family glycosyltransferase
MSAPLLDVGVVIVTYKTARLTIACLESIDRQRNGPGYSVRAVVVDNQSGDAPEIRAAIADRGWSDWARVVESDRNGGFAYGNNVGVRALNAAGAPAYYHFLNPDTQLLDGAIAELVKFLEANPAVGIAGGSFKNSDGSDWRISFRFPGLISQMIDGIAFGPLTRIFRHSVIARVMSPVNQPVDWLCGASMMVRPGVIAATGGMDENYFLYFEETDFCRRALLAGFSSWYVPASLVMHHGGASTHVTGADEGRKRLPPYWFASRRRYFAVTFGLPKAILIDAVAVASQSVGLLKNFFLGRLSEVRPHFIRDLIRESIVWPRNRPIPAAACTALREDPTGV